MATITVSDQVAELVATAAAARGYASTGDYVVDLVRADQVRDERLNRLLVKGEESGMSDLSLQDVIDREFAKPLGS